MKVPVRLASMMKYLLCSFLGLLVAGFSVFPLSILWMIIFYLILNSVGVIKYSDLDDMLIAYAMIPVAGIIGGILAPILTRNKTILGSRVLGSVWIGCLTGLISALIPNLFVFYWWIKGIV
jgi:hypothetical protein